MPIIRKETMGGKSATGFRRKFGEERKTKRRKAEENSL